MRIHFNITVIAGEFTKRFIQREIQFERFQDDSKLAASHYTFRSPRFSGERPESPQKFSIRK